MILKLSNKVYFWKFVLTSARNLSLLKQFTLAYASERSRYPLSENGIVYYATTYFLDILGIRIEQFFELSAALASLFNILLANIS